MKTLSVPETASRMGLSVDEVIVLIRKGKLLSIETGGWKKQTTYYVIEDSIDEYMKKKDTKITSKSISSREYSCPIRSLSNVGEWYHVIVKVVKDGTVSQLKRKLNQINYLFSRNVSELLDYFGMTEGIDFVKYRIHDHSDRELFLTTPVEDLVPIKGSFRGESIDEIYIIVEPRKFTCN